MSDIAMGERLERAEAAAREAELDRDSYKRQLEEFAAANETLRGKLSDAEARAERAEAKVAELRKPELARHQPCGCVVCACEDEERCHGCGAKSCGTHPVGEIPNPIYRTPDPEIERLREAVKEIRSELTFFIGSYDAGSVQMDSEECPCVERGVKPHKFYEHWLGGIRAWLAKHGEEK